MEPLLSVVIPAYNEEKLLGRCLQAVSNQTFPREKYEILVIDNNSSDKTAEIAKNAGATVMHYKEKQGFSVAKQYGAAQAKADIIAFTDADSVPDKNWLGTAYQLMQNPKFVCIGGTIVSTDKKVNFLFVFYDLVAQINQLFGIPLIWSPNMIVRKKAFFAINGFNLKLKTSDDWDLIVRFQKHFGIRSVLYTHKLLVETSPRRQEKISLLIPYMYIGIMNYFTVFLLRHSQTFGAQKSIR